MTTPTVPAPFTLSVRCRYYFRFRRLSLRTRVDVMAYDHRGTGDAVLRHAERSFSGQPIHVVAHSVGGFVLGLAESNHLIRRVFTVGAQYAYWSDYAAGTKLRMVAKWHVVMPLITMIFGYFPGKRLGWLEDAPKGVVRDWIFSRERFEDTWRGRSSARYPDKHVPAQQFAAVTAPTPAVRRISPIARGRISGSRPNRLSSQLSAISASSTVGSKRN